MERCFDISGHGFSRWVGIINPNAEAPERGVYLIARVGPGQGFDIEYEVRVIEKGESFEVNNCQPSTHPIAFHYVPEESPNLWIHTNLLVHRFENPSIPAPIAGVPIIAYREDTRRKGYPDVKYRLGSRSWHGVGQYRDVAESFKTFAGNGDGGWDDQWDGCTIIGFHIASEYSAELCMKHVSLRREAEPSFLRE